MANLLEGKKIALKIKEELKRQIERLSHPPVLASIQVGENPSSQVYIRSQRKTAQALGVDYRLYSLNEKTNQRELIELIQQLNANHQIHGLIIQLPLPEHIDYRYIYSFVEPKKDAEGMHPENLGRILVGKYEVLPCTAAAVMELVDSTDIKLYGKETVIVGHSEIVGKPLSLLFLNRFATTSVCHIATSEAGRLIEHIKRAEVLVVAVGKANLIKGEWIKPGAVVVDVGINKVGEKIVGDVEFEAAAKKAAYITPVPGGVGPLTVVMLMRNLVKLIKALPAV